MFRHTNVTEHTQMSVYVVNIPVSGPTQHENMLEVGTLHTPEVGMLHMPEMDMLHTPEVGMLHTPELPEDTAEVSMLEVRSSHAFCFPANFFG